MDDAFEATLAALRPALLRHCYRMLGCFQDAEETLQEALLNAWKGRESYAGKAPPEHWLFRIATNACLNARKARQRRLHLGSPAATGTRVTEPPIDPSEFITPAPDALLFPAPEDHALRREDVSFAFIALLQQLAPVQRAALLLKDVIGFSSEEIAEALDLSTAAVSSALHRARSSMPPPAASPDPTPEVLRDYVRCWEQRDLEGLLRLLKDDVVFTMPPHALWFQGREAVRAFLLQPPFSLFWASGVKLLPVAANGSQAFVFYRDGGQNSRAIQHFRFDGEQFAELHNWIGMPYMHGFVLPEHL